MPHFASGSRAEREACLDRLAKAQEASGPYRLNLDRRGAFARKDIEPFLARKPKNEITGEEEAA